MGEIKTPKATITHEYNFNLWLCKHMIQHFTKQQTLTKAFCQLLLLFKGANIGIDDEDDSTFTISCDQKTFHFQGNIGIT